MTLVRPATLADIPVVTTIYEHHVRHGLATFEETPPTVEEMRRRFERVVGLGLPYLVAEAAGSVRGYAYAAPYRERSAYRFSVENSVYVHQNWGRRGIGRALLAELIARATAAGKRQMISVIGDSANAASIGLHAAMGFRLAGTLPSAGFKFGRWVDSVLMVLPLGPGDTAPPAG